MYDDAGLRSVVARVVALSFVVLGLLCTGGLPVVASAATPGGTYKLQALFGNGQGIASGASDVAVSPATGNIFIAEFNNGAVGVFSPDASAGGNLLTHPDVYSPSGRSAQDLAADPSSDALYVADSAFGVGVSRFLSDGAPTPTYTFDSSFAPSGFVAPGGMAVDPVSHDLYVVDRGANRVVRLDAADGHEVASLDGANTGTAFAGARTVAVGPTGMVYVVDMAGRRVERFSAAGSSLGALALPSSATPSAISVNLQTGAVVVVLGIGGQTIVTGYSSAGAHTFSARVTGAVSSPSTGLAWNGVSDRLYISHSDGTAFMAAPALAPGLDAPAVTAGANTAHASAEVAPGGEDTTARFEYCASTLACDDYPYSDPNDASNPWKRGPDHPNLTTTTTIQDDLPLSSNATWKVRVSADNTVSGTDSTSDVTTVSSPLVAPVVTTGAAGSVTESQAELNGTIDTIGSATTYHFEYGLTTSYGSRAPASSDAAAGNNRIPRAVSRIIGGLQSGTTYHYRLVATNAAGTSAGSDRTFATAGPDLVAPDRAYEQVTPVNKQGAQVLSDFRVHASEDGSAIAVSTVGAPLNVESSLILQNLLSRRGPDDWMPWQPLDPPQNAAPGLLEASTMAISADFDHALVASNRALAPGGIIGGGNLYEKNLRTGAYTFVGGAAGNDAYGLLVGLQANERVFLGAAPDFSWIVFYSAARLLPTVSWPAVYRWSRATGALTVESRLPDDSLPPIDAQSPAYGQLTVPTVSSDGEAVAFGLASAGGSIPAGVYRRVNGQTTPVSASKIAGDPPDAQPAFFDGMTADGRFVFFHGPVRLTDDAPVLNLGEASLYRYDVTADVLTYLGPTEGVGNKAVRGFSSDGETVYALNGNAGTFVWRNGQARLVTSGRAAQESVSSDGRYFSWSDGGDGDGAIHLYDAVSTTSICVSCPTDGGSSTDARMKPTARTMSNRSARSMLDDGTVFFTTAQRLITSDHNGARDVYMYRNGRLTLISPGERDFDALFVDASADGRSVFFQTDEGLVSQDTDGETDVYVARVGGGFANQNPPLAPAPCVRADCGEVASGPVSSPVVPSSGTGSGNPVGRTNQERVVLSVGRVSVGAKSVKVSLQANQRGRVRVSGSRVTTTIRNVSKAGTYSVSVPLSKKARALRRAHKKFKLSLGVSLSGGWGSASVKYTRTLGK